MRTVSLTLGMRVIPPTRITSSIFRGSQSGVLECGSARPDGLLDQIANQRLQLGAGECHGQMLGAGLVGGDKRQIDLGLYCRGKLDLGLFGGLLEPLQGSRSLRRSIPCCFLNSSAR